MAISIWDATPCAVLRQDQNTFPRVLTDPEGRDFISLAAENTPMLSDASIQAILGAPGMPMEESLHEVLDVPRQGLLSTLHALAMATRSAHRVVLAVLREASLAGRNQARYLAPLAGLAGPFRTHMIRALVAPFRSPIAGDVPVRLATSTLRAYTAAHAAAANPLTGEQYPLVRFARCRANDRMSALEAIVGREVASTPGRFVLASPQMPGRVEIGLLAPAFADEDDTASVDDRHTASDFEAIRGLTASLLDEVGMVRRHVDGALGSMQARLGRFDFRAPGEEQLATVDDLSAFRESSANLFESGRRSHLTLAGRVNSLDVALSHLLQAVTMLGRSTEHRDLAVGAEFSLAREAAEHALALPPEPARAIYLAVIGRPAARAAAEAARGPAGGGPGALPPPA